MKFLSLVVIVFSSISALGAPPQQAATCIACHGADGNPAVATYPVLAGKSEEFIISQLEKFEKGEIKSVTVMNSMVAAVKDPAAKKAVAKFYASQKCKARCNEAPKK